MEELIPKEISETPAAIRATLEESRVEARRAADLIIEREPRRIYLIGNGTSYYSSLAAAYCARELAGSSDPLVLAMPSGDFRYFTPQLNRNDVIVGITASGEFRDVLAVFREFEGKCLRIGITHVPGSSVTRLADAVLVSKGGASQVPVMTKTYASTLVAAYLLVLEFFGASGETFSGLEKSAELAASAIGEAAARIPHWLDNIKKFKSAFYFGNGSGYAAAMEAALKMKEMALFHAEGCESWEMASGPATLVNEEILCVALYTGDRTDTAVTEMSQHVKGWGSTVVEAGPTGFTSEYHLKIEMPSQPMFAPLVLVPPLASLAYQFARGRGVDPNKPGWRERYHAQGMTHIIG